MKLSVEFITSVIPNIQPKNISGRLVFLFRIGSIRYVTTARDRGQCHGSLWHRGSPEVGFRLLDSIYIIESSTYSHKTGHVV